eukprot:TRINITY_DN968_c0_g1_i1.p1 TRINITY_DN968_c0_g1~~TRINITY_DN968_c0_g1_i1.p1  ORF type:complete len:151 (-),score=19.82 TRINITY_DN968_c0_g1_i1:92-544(-)
MSSRRFTDGMTQDMDKDLGIDESLIARGGTRMFAEFLSPYKCLGEYVDTDRGKLCQAAVDFGKLTWLYEHGKTKSKCAGELVAARTRPALHKKLESWIATIAGPSVWTSKAKNAGVFCKLSHQKPGKKAKVKYALANCAKLPNKAVTPSL